jgi:hypothetical protein
VWIVWAGLRLKLGKNFVVWTVYQYLWFLKREGEKILCVALEYQAGFDFGSKNDFFVAWTLHFVMLRTRTLRNENALRSIF